jgi:hypothetical protein
LGVYLLAPNLLSGFVSSLGGSFMQANARNMSLGAKVSMSAVIGGTVEKLGGGKFANGAVTGAYVMMFNHLRTQEPERKGFPTSKELKRDFAESFEEKVGAPYINNPEYLPLSPDKLAKDILNSGDLNSDKHGFSLRAFDIRIETISDNITLSSELFQRVPYHFSDFLPTTYNPGIEGPILKTISNNIRYEFVIRYQIIEPL